jgi:hypothetical protein
MLELLRQIEDQFSTRALYDYGRNSRQFFLMMEAQRTIRAAGGKVIGLDDDDAEGQLP